MYCHNCGAKLPDGAKFCHECGEKTVINGTNASLTAMPPSVGYLVITRYFSEYNSDIPVDVFVNGARETFIANDETIKLTYDVGKYFVSLRQNGFVIHEEQIEINSGRTEFIRFEVDDSFANTNPTRQTMPVPNQAIVYPNPGIDSGRVCPRCGGQMQIQTVSESRKAGCGIILLYILLACTILGLLIIIPLMLRKKTETVTYAVCQKCGYTKPISRH